MPEFFNIDNCTLFYLTVTNWWSYCKENHYKEGIYLYKINRIVRSIEIILAKSI